MKILSSVDNFMASPQVIVFNNSLRDLSEMKFWIECPVPWDWFAGSYLPRSECNREALWGQGQKQSFSSPFSHWRKTQWEHTAACAAQPSASCPQRAESSGLGPCLVCIRWGQQADASFSPALLAEFGNWKSIHHEETEQMAHDLLDPNDFLVFILKEYALSSSPVPTGCVQRGLI